MINNRGISIIGTVATLIILGVFGAALISLVAMEQESRMRSIHREQTFYAIQAGFEYALREIKEVGYPWAINKSLGDATFTVAVSPEQNQTEFEAGDVRVMVAGGAVDSGRTHSITVDCQSDLLSNACLNIDDSGALLGGTGNRELQGVTLTDTCADDVTVGYFIVAWNNPDPSERVRRITIDGNVVYDYEDDEDDAGAESCDLIGVSGYTFTDQAVIDAIEFSTGMTGKRITVTSVYQHGLAWVQKQF